MSHVRAKIRVLAVVVALAGIGPATSCEAKGCQGDHPDTPDYRTACPEEAARKDRTNGW